MIRLVVSASPNPNQDLVQNYVVKYFATGGASSLEKPRAWRQHRSIISAVPDPQRDFRAAHTSTPRALRESSTRGKVLSGNSHRRTKRLCLAHECQAAVVGDVQPLVSVGCPGFGLFDSICEVTKRGEAVAHRPKAPLTCTQTPSPCTRAQISPTGSKAPVFTLPRLCADDGGAGKPAETPLRAFSPASPPGQTNYPDFSPSRGARET